jgi:hypothetical protein
VFFFFQKKKQKAVVLQLSRLLINGCLAFSGKKQVFLTALQKYFYTCFLIWMVGYGFSGLYSFDMVPFQKKKQKAVALQHNRLHINGCLLFSEKKQEFLVALQKYV